jgi:hypothetical protein
MTRREALGFASRYWAQQTVVSAVSVTSAVPGVAEQDTFDAVPPRNL